MATRTHTSVYQHLKETEASLYTRRIAESRTSVRNSGNLYTETCDSVGVQDKGKVRSRRQDSNNLERCEQSDDLGFVEGDYIDCIHPGDGQWWFGKLRRNKMMGNFPSNFVTLVESASPDQKTVSSNRSNSRASARLANYRSDSYNYETGTYDTDEPRYSDEHNRYLNDAAYLSDTDAENANDDAPPPLPPPHKVLIRPKSAMSMLHTIDGQQERTSTPLRTAMEDIMHSLDDMSFFQEQRFTAQPAYQPDSEADIINDHIAETELTNAPEKIERPVSSLSKYGGGGFMRRLTLNRPKSSLGLGRLNYDHDGKVYDDAHEESLSNASIRPKRSILRMRSLSRANTMKSTSTVSNGFSTVSGSSAPTTISDTSATSAGSLARRKAMSRMSSNDNETAVVLPPAVRTGYQTQFVQNTSSFGPLKLKKSGFFQKLKNIGSGVSSSGKSIASVSTTSLSHVSNSVVSTGITSYAPSISKADATMPKNAQSTQWIQAQTDIHRAHSISKNERDNRRRRQELEGYAVSNPLGVLEQRVEGDEGADGKVVYDGMDVSKFNFVTLDKAVRALSIPSLSTLSSFTITVLCRPYKSDIQRLRAIFTFCTERIMWQHSSVLLDDDYYEPSYDTSRIFRSKRASSDELAYLIKSMCEMLQIPCEVIKGYLKTPGEVVEGITPRVNHAWNAVVVDGEWRLIDASLACPAHPRRSQYTNCQNTIAEDFYFLAKPSELIFSHIPRYRTHQHIVPSLSHELILQLPSICPAMFRYNLFLSDFDTSLLRTSGADLIQIDIQAPLDVDCIAELEVRGFCVDVDGDLMESGEMLKFPCLAQAYWAHGRRLFRIKGSLPDKENSGVLKVYAGRRGLLQSTKDNPYPLAIAFPVSHIGPTKPFDFVVRHPAPQALRYDLYVVQPQCRVLLYGNTYTIEVKQCANNVESPVFSPAKQAKLAIQSPSDKITRLNPKDGADSSAAESTWEALVTCNDVGTWRGLVMADRSSTWCVFAEWSCVR